MKKRYDYIYPAEGEKYYTIINLQDSNVVLAKTEDRFWAEKIVKAMNDADKPTETQIVYEAARQRILDQDAREVAGEDVSGEIRARMPGGSDF